MEFITKWFWGWFPWSLSIILLPLILLYMSARKGVAPIKNRVEVFFKGGTKAYYPCIIEKDIAKFDIEGVSYQEPITHHPRLEYDKEKKIIYRSYLFAEGVGIVDVPPLTKEDRGKIITTLRQYDILEKKDDGTTYTDEDLMNMVVFYNFDIEQVLDKPVLKSYSVSMSGLEHFIDELRKQITRLEGGESNMKTFLKIISGFLIGFGFAWALTLKGLI